VSGRVIQGWHSDPFGVHEARYFSAGQPTKLVRDRGTESYDEPPSGADAVAAAMARPSAPPAPAAPPSAYAPRDAYPYGPASERGSRRRASGIAGFAASGIIVVAAAVAAVLVAQTIMHPSKHPSPSGAGDVALVNQAATRTLQQRTADVVFSASTAAGAVKIAMHGTGAFDLGGKAGTVNITTRTQVGVMAVREILLDGHIYMAVSFNGRSFLSKGKVWLDQVFSQEPGTTEFNGSNLTATLVSLENQGNTVRALGTKVIGGVSCTGYSVTSPDGQATSTVWINPQHLVREISGDATLDVPSGGASASAAPTSATSAPSLDLTMDFSYSTVPLHVTAPPAASTVS
jgi:hypothetical protein